MTPAEESRHLLKIGVETGQYPRFLYKYRAPDLSSEPEISENSDSKRFTEKIIRNRSMWFATPTGFNDPFDCQHFTDTNNTIAEIQQFILDVDPTANLQEVQRISLYAYQNPNELSNIVNGAISRKLNSMGIGCFTKKPDNILMWSHYANSHTGLCLKFDVLKNLDFFANLLPAHYELTYPIYNHIRAPHELVNKLILTKYKQWDYEDEWRSVQYKGPGLYSFDDALVEVIFGCNASQEFIARIQIAASESGYNSLSYKKATVSKDSYTMFISDL